MPPRSAPAKPYLFQINSTLYIFFDCKKKYFFLTSGRSLGEIMAVISPPILSPHCYPDYYWKLTPLQLTPKEQGKLYTHLHTYKNHNILEAIVDLFKSLVGYSELQQAARLVAPHLLEKKGPDSQKEAEKKAYQLVSELLVTLYHPVPHPPPLSGGNNSEGSPRTYPSPCKGEENELTALLLEEGPPPSQDPAAARASQRLTSAVQRALSADPLPPEKTPPFPHALSAGELKRYKGKHPPPLSCFRTALDYQDTKV